jgi:hypothetical protein
MYSDNEIHNNLNLLFVYYIIIVEEQAIAMWDKFALQISPHCLLVGGIPPSPLLSLLKGIERDGKRKKNREYKGKINTKRKRKN